MPMHDGVEFVFSRRWKAMAQRAARASSTRILKQATCSLQPAPDACPPGKVLELSESPRPHRVPTRPPKALPARRLLHVSPDKRPSSRYVDPARMYLVVGKASSLPAPRGSCAFKGVRRSGGLLAGSSAGTPRSAPSGLPDSRSAVREAVEGCLEAAAREERFQDVGSWPWGIKARRVSPRPALLGGPPAVSTGRRGAQAPPGQRAADPGYTTARPTAPGHHVLRPRPQLAADDGARARSPGPLDAVGLKWRPHARRPSFERRRAPPREPRRPDPAKDVSLLRAAVARSRVGRTRGSGPAPEVVVRSRRPIVMSLSAGARGRPEGAPGAAALAEATLMGLRAEERTVLFCGFFHRPPASERPAHRQDRRGGGPAGWERRAGRATYLCRLARCRCSERSPRVVTSGAFSPPPEPPAGRLPLAGPRSRPAAPAAAEAAGRLCSEPEVEWDRGALEAGSTAAVLEPPVGSAPEDVSRPRPSPRGQPGPPPSSPAPRAQVVAADRQAPSPSPEAAPAQPAGARPRGPTTRSQHGSRR
jgi:hypothetical protein